MSCHPGLASSINASFQARRHFFNFFSCVMASSISSNDVRTIDTACHYIDVIFHIQKFGDILLKFKVKNKFVIPHKPERRRCGTQRLFNSSYGTYRLGPASPLRYVRDDRCFYLNPYAPKPSATSSHQDRLLTQSLSLSPHRGRHRLRPSLWRRAPLGGAGSFWRRPRRLAVGFIAPAETLSIKSPVIAILTNADIRDI